MNSDYLMNSTIISKNDYIDVMLYSRRLSCLDSEMDIENIYIIWTTSSTLLLHILYLLLHVMYNDVYENVFLCF